MHLQNSIKALLPLVVLLGNACHKEQDFPPAYREEPQSYCLTAALPDEPETRSDRVSEADASDARDIHLAVYTGGKRVADGPMPLNLRLLANRRYNFYAWTDRALPRDAVPENEEELSGWEAVYPGWDTAGDAAQALPQLLADYGMPMAGVRTGCKPGDIAVDGLITVPLQRLFAKVRLRILYDASMQFLLPERVVEQVSIHNWAWACHPFDSGFDPAKVHSGSIDIATSAEGDGSYTLYLPENLQGSLPEGDPDRCSYISVDLRLSDGLGYGGGVGDVCYRFYPGADGADGYDIHRNRQYDVTLSLSYNGRFIEGEWKVSGDDAEQRSLAFTEADCQPLAAPGSKAYLRLSYTCGASGDVIRAYFNRFNGVAVGRTDQIEDWIGSGSAPAGSALEVVGSLRCRHCGNRFWGVPEAASRRFMWANVVLDADISEVRCPVCRTHFFFLDSAEEDRFTNGTPADSDNYRMTAPEPYIAVSVPDDAVAGTLIPYRAATRDGRVLAEQNIAVGDLSALYFNQPLDGEQYVAQRLSFTPAGLPDGVTQLSYRTVLGTDCIAINPSLLPAGGAQISFLKAGEVDILVEDQNGTVRQRISRTIRNPGLQFLTGDTQTSEYALAISGTALEPGWTYCRADGSSYTDYNASLYASLLGDPVLSTDGTWTTVDGNSVYIHRTNDGTLGDIPYLSSSVGTLTATCPNLPEVQAEANLTAINPFSGWPSSPVEATVNYSWTEDPKKDGSLPVFYNESLMLRGRFGAVLPLYAESIRGNPPFGYSSAEAIAHTSFNPTIAKRPSKTLYYGQVVNSHSGTALKRGYLLVAVNVEAYCTESHVQTESGKTRSWQITASCRNPSGSLPSQSELAQVVKENTSAPMLPTPGEWTYNAGLSCHWVQAYYTWGTQDASYKVSLVIKNNTSTHTGDATFSTFSGRNAVQFSTPYVLSDNYSYLQIEGEPLDSPSTDGVWKIRFNPDWQSD